MEYDDPETLSGSPDKGLARRLARGFLSSAGIKSYPIRILDVSKFIPDLFIDGNEMEDEISGIQATYKGQFFIRYNSAHPVKRNRFTVAHEIGHLLLGHTNPCSNRPHDKSPNEIEANQFAAELLMPLSMLKVAVKTHTSVSDLAKVFWVSKEAMSIRVMETRIYNQLKSWS